MVSMVLDYGHRIPPEDYSIERYRALWEMIEAAKKFDQKQGEDDCEEPEKVDFLKQIIDRIERIEKRLDHFDAKVELERVNRVLGPQPQPQPEVISVVIDPSPPIDTLPYPVIDPLNPFPFGFGGVGAGSPHITTVKVPSSGTPTRTVTEETDEQRDRRLNAGYCPKCGGQWVEAPCADPDHRRRRYGG